jgi:limonene-1,2-epoxide hydrolase
LEHCAQAFVDDLLIYSQDFESHVQHVEAVLAALQAAGLRAHPGRVCSARTRWSTWAMSSRHPALNPKLLRSRQ